MFWRASANAVEASDSAEPKTFPEAVNGPDQVHWRKAIRAELKSMRLRGVFRAAKLPNNQRACGAKGVIKIKRNADGSMEKYKVRLVAKGFVQKYGIDYTETFSPVVKYVTLRMIIAIAKYIGWPIDQLDVVNAFLYGLMKCNGLIQRVTYVGRFHMDTYTKVGTGTRLACAPLSLPDWMKVGSQTPFSQSGIDLDLSGSHKDGWPPPPSQK
ncbi:unnamed protein product [Phytophthora fragariaefolia]|uniref:Unnamed protein product n=1 Tax=Phytophthora fragariaefolia TaxID=1490495 RepID=A0A9W6YRI8_9STRA|nr:unnamed protein product [Phytophthora fragariaefolia]